MTTSLATGTANRRGARYQLLDDVEMRERTLSDREKLLGRLESILICPQCRGRLDLPAHSEETSANIGCRKCGVVGGRGQTQINLGGFSQTELRQDYLNDLKEMAKRTLGRFYPLALSLISPVYMRNLVPGFLRTFNLNTDLVADLGSGTNSYRDRVICVDGGNYPNVHLTADLSKLPFSNNSLSGIISVAVLEHVPNPAVHVQEFLRVLKPGGKVLCYIPFIQGYHASPHDYQRYTSQGMKKLFSEFTDVTVSVGAGPTSGFIWILQEYLATIFSFGNLRLYRMLVPLTWLLSPLKYLDALLIHHPAADAIASGFFVQACKPE